jgi:polar amino acid transport system substrate-binding protein
MKFIIIAITFFLFLNSSSFAKKTVTIMTYDVLPPFAFKNENKELTGIYIEIVKKALSRMPDYNVIFDVVPWSRAKLTIKKGKAFAILPPYFHAHDWLTDSVPKRPYIWPYSLALFKQSDVVICNKRVSNREFKKYPNDFKGLNFVMWRGDGRAGVAFQKLVEDKKINVVLVEDIKSTVGFMVKGRADCTVTSNIPFYYWAKRLFKNKLLKKGNIKNLYKAMTISENNGYLGYTDINDETNYPFKKDFTIKFDIEIFKMKKSGEINKIVEMFIGKK